MPLYRCTIPKDSLSYEDREHIANEITRIHCEVTGAPKTFVHVFMFEEDSREDFAINGSIRFGRTDEQKADLKSQMQSALAQRAGVDTEKVSVNTMDVMARWTMEGGDVLPEPGEEEAWLAKHAAT